MSAEEIGQIACLERLGQDLIINVYPFPVLNRSLRKFDKGRNDESNKYLSHLVG